MISKPKIKALENRDFIAQIAVWMDFTVYRLRSADQDAPKPARNGSLNPAIDCPHVKQSESIELWPDFRDISRHKKTGASLQRLRHKRDCPTGEPLTDYVASLRSLSHLPARRRAQTMAVALGKRGNAAGKCDKPALRGDQPNPLSALPFFDRPTHAFKTAP